MGVSSPGKGSPGAFDARLARFVSLRYRVETAPGEHHRSGDARAEQSTFQSAGDERGDGSKALFTEQIPDLVETQPRIREGYPP